LGHAADEAPAGTWKMSLYIEPGEGLPPEKQLLWLVQLESADGKWTAKVLDRVKGAPQATTGDVKVADGTLRFTLTLGETPFQFEGQLPKGEVKVLTGAVSRPKRAIPAELERTTVKALDAFELDKEALPTTTGFAVTVKAMSLLEQAEKHKAKPEEVRSWAEKAYKAAEVYGPRLQADITLEIAEALAQQDGYADVAVNFARRAERGLEPKTKLPRVKRTLDALATALKKAGKADEAKEVEGRIAKLSPEIKPVPYAGRKAKSDRVVLVELFTGAQCPPCVAADKAFDALEKTYKPGEVVLLEYHEHIPGPDPLTNPPAEARLRYYFGREAATPNAVFGGKPGAPGGGDAFEALEKYEEYLDTINPLLEQPSKGALTAGAVRKGNKVEIAAEASDVAVADGVRLRLALVEELVDYKGSNGIPSYHNVVRDMPGGVTGIAVKDRAAKQAVTVDLDELKKDLKKYLDNWAAENEAKFPGKVPEMELKNLRVVAFLQNDKTKEVLQAVQVDVKGEK
jgi:thiol-disulfide isomerase/thioredoxin